VAKVWHGLKAVEQWLEAWQGNQYADKWGRHREYAHGDELAAPNHVRTPFSTEDATTAFSGHALSLLYEYTEFSCITSSHSVLLWAIAAHVVPSRVLSDSMRRLPIAEGAQPCTTM
jgi:hypothetical protein